MEAFPILLKISGAAWAHAVPAGTRSVSVHKASMMAQESANSGVSAYRADPAPQTLARLHACAGAARRRASAASVGCERACGPNRPEHATPINATATEARGGAHSDERRRPSAGGRRLAGLMAVYNAARLQNRSLRVNTRPSESCGSGQLAIPSAKQVAAQRSDALGSQSLHR
jgi:hypothetical protein